MIAASGFAFARPHAFPYKDRQQETGGRRSMTEPIIRVAGIAWIRLPPPALHMAGKIALGRLICALALGLLALGLPAPGSAAADDYPARPIRFLQGFAPGGNADAISRVLGEELSKALGQPVISESRAGAGGNLATDVAAKAPPDGYTIVLLTTGHVISAALYRSLPFDPNSDLQYISTVSDFPFFFVVRADSKYRSIADLAAAAKAKDGAVTFGSAGVGTGQHLTGELFATSIGAKMIHVPFRGDSGALTGLLSGDIDFIIAPATAVAGNVQAGTLRVLATSGPARWDGWPDVPAAAETAAPGFEVLAWTGVATAKGVPRPVVDRLNATFRNILAMPHVQRRLAELGSTAHASSPEEMAARVRTQIARWRNVIDAAGIPRQ
jgi:tripartite-type tricarboxylate transporter receptor subunit TctC